MVKLALIIVMLIIAGIDSAFFPDRSHAIQIPKSSSGRKKRPESRLNISKLMDKPMTVPTIPHHKPFEIKFEDGHRALAVCTTPTSDAKSLLNMLGLTENRPAIFITGGASNMSSEDMERTRRIIEDGIAPFAARHNAIVVDGGTESGVMQMIGQARHIHNYKFPLIGVAPLGKVEYPGHVNPDKEADLEDSHTHFVLVDAADWGDESNMIISITRAICEGGKPAIGVLINGGRIARQEVLLATSQGQNSLPILVLEGSGRTADQIATAFRTGKTNQAIIKAIIEGGDIELVATIEGPSAVLKKLEKRFARKR